MKIFITTPCFAPHGGIRNILEIANRLAEKHTVFLRNLGGDSCNWFKFSPKLRMASHDNQAGICDLQILTSPHSNKFLGRHGKKLLYLQMLEHLFKPADRAWRTQCERFYKAPYPLITTAQWNVAHLTTFGRRQMTVIPTGTNPDHFPLVLMPKDKKTVLVEGWAVTNQAKDVDRLAPQAAEYLRGRGYRIVAYGLSPITDYAHVPDEYHLRPTLETMNRLYSEATILLKASVYDNLAVAPLEAATKGTVTVRALEQGDSWLVDGRNCRRSNYSSGVSPLVKNCLDVLGNTEIREFMARGCVSHTMANRWGDIMPLVEKAIEEAA